MYAPFVPSLKIFVAPSDVDNLILIEPAKSNSVVNVIAILYQPFP